MFSVYLGLTCFSFGVCASQIFNVIMDTRAFRRAMDEAQAGMAEWRAKKLQNAALKEQARKTRGFQA